MSGSRVALVSGGSRGIGRAVTRRLAQDGFDVSFCFHDNELASQQLAKELAELGARVLPMRTDVSDMSSVQSWVTQTELELGPIDAVVASAGITRDGPLALMSQDQWHQVLNTNLSGVFHVCQAAMFGMLKRRAGCVVTLSSISGVYGNPRQVNYSAAKAGIIGFSRALAKEVGSRGIRVNTVAPGLIATDMIDRLADPVRRRMLNAIPLGRFGQAEEVADLVAFLVSDRASYITGGVLEIHGGLAI